MQIWRKKWLKLSNHLVYTLRIIEGLQRGYFEQTIRNQCLTKTVRNWTIDFNASETVMTLKNKNLKNAPHCWLFTLYNQKNWNLIVNKFINLLIVINQIWKEVYYSLRSNNSIQSSLKCRLFLSLQHSDKVCSQMLTVCWR